MLFPPFERTRFSGVSSYEVTPAQKGPRMDWSDDPAQLCAELLAANHLLFETDHLEAAYHALAAALHCADDCDDATMLRRIETAALQQHRQLAQRVPLGELWEAARVEVSMRWASLERIYAAVERQASAKAASHELRRTRRRSTQAE